MAVLARLPSWTGLAVALLALASAGCHRDSAKYITGPLPASLTLSTANAQRLDAPQWRTQQKWKRQVELGSRGCQPNEHPFFVALKGGGLAFDDENSHGYLLGGDGSSLPHPWFDESEIVKRIRAEHPDWYNEYVAADPADSIVWDESGVIVLPAGGLAVTTARHCYCLDSAGQVLGTADLPAGFSLSASAPAIAAGQPPGVVLWGRDGRQLTFDRQAQLVADSKAPLAPDRGLDFQLGPNGQLYTAGFGSKGIVEFDATGHRIWENGQIDLKWPGFEVSVLPSGDLLVADSEVLYLLNDAGRCSWRATAATAPSADGLGIPAYAVGPDSVITFGDTQHLFFVKSDGTPAAPPLAIEFADPKWRASDWTWKPNPSGGAFVRVRSTTPGQLERCWVYAISANGQGFWRVEVPHDFELLCATDTGFVYGLQNRQTTGGPDRWSYVTTADVVCLIVVPAAS